MKIRLAHSIRLLARASIAVFFLLGVSARAQWETQDIVVRPGWSAVYLHVDASHLTLEDLVAADNTNPIQEIWMWRPPVSPNQFVTTPQTPINADSRWSSWLRSGAGTPSTFNRLTPNTAFLVRSTAAANYTWRVKGKPIVPVYNWTATGLNLIGFPTVDATPPMFDRFLAPAPAFLSAAEIYQYIGGDLNPSNPGRVFAYHTVPVTRGRAFWARSGSFVNTYFGPFQVLPASGSSVDFGSESSHSSLRLRNVTAAPVTVTLRLAASEAAPAGQPAIVGRPAILARGALNPETLTYGYTDLTTAPSASWTLAPQGEPGSEATVMLGLNRRAMGGTPGARFAGVLRFTDSLGYTDVRIGVAATAASDAGLWVGNATVNQVGNYLKAYQRDAENNPVQGANGAYVVTGVNTALAPAPKPFSLRLIVHNDGTTARLMQRVYVGPNAAGNTIVAASEAALDRNKLGSARRISASHLPFTGNNENWPFEGQFAAGGSLVATAILPYDDGASNPFIHTYHPDHDNLNASFNAQLSVGGESYRVTRRITLQMAAPANDFASLTTGNAVYHGDYSETVTIAGLGGATRDFNVRGIFSLNHVSNLSTLTP